MSVTIVVGGQFGSEGKGKVAHYYAAKQNCTVAVRVGGPNSGHTIVDEQGKIWVFRHLPTAAILPDTLNIIPAGAYLDVDILFQELADTGLSSDRLVIDRNAVIISKTEVAY